MLAAVKQDTHPHAALGGAAERGDHGIVGQDEGGQVDIAPDHHVILAHDSPDGFGHKQTLISIALTPDQARAAGFDLRGFVSAINTATVADRDRLAARSRNCSAGSSHPPPRQTKLRLAPPRYSWRSKARKRTRTEKLSLLMRRPSPAFQAADDEHVDRRKTTISCADIERSIAKPRMTSDRIMSSIRARPA